MLSVEQIKELVGNRFFEVCFVKKDGTERCMNARRGVKRYLKGGHDSSPKVVAVWDREKLRENISKGMDRWKAGNAAYRCFLPESIKWIKVAGKVYDANGKELKNEA